MAKKKDESEALKPELDSRNFVEHAPRGAARIRNFDEFWFKVSKELGLALPMKHQIWTYFKSIGILNDPAKYDEGLRQFGL